MKMTAHFVTAALAVALLTAFRSAAYAEPLLFDLSGTVDGESVVDTFVLDSNPTPSEYFPNEYAFFTDIAGQQNGTPATFVVEVNAQDNLGGIFVSYPDFQDGIPIQVSGSQVFSGSVSSPVFTPAAYSFAGGPFPLFPTYTAGPTTLTITSVSATPEPSSWLLMIAGVSFVGALLRRRPQIAALPVPTAAGA